MIHISDIANRIEDFLRREGENKFRIFIRINFSIDVYVCTSDSVRARSYKEEFVQQLSSEDDEFYRKHSDQLRIKFNFIDEEESDDPFYSNMFNSDEDVIDRGPRFRFDSLLGRKEHSQQENNKKRPPVVTFYSYKGGMGRTTTMIAYAMSLATNMDGHKKTVVIIDCDLEAPGYLNFFNLSEHNGLMDGKKNGLVEFFSDAEFLKDPEKLDINDYVINVGLDNNNTYAYKNLDNIYIVPAGNLNEGYREADVNESNDQDEYLEGLAKINLANVSVVKYDFNLLFDKINETIHPDIILVDSRTGFNDVFGTATLYLSDYVVGFFGFSRQTQPGLMRLLKEYYKPTNDFKLQLVFSILPEPDKVDEHWLQTHEQKTRDYVNYVSTETKDFPSFLYLHRNPIMEKIGMGDDRSDAEFVNIVQNRKNEDYNTLFDSVNSQLFPNKDEQPVITKNTPAIKLRNIILKHLKSALGNVSNFAENTKIEESQFFYRECMKELFDPSKFLIQGYKGTGKTYLYKALADKEISKNLQKWTGNDIQTESVFINILPLNETELVFHSILYSKIEEPEYYFNSFWQIYTWNAIMLDERFKDVRTQSKLQEHIKPLDGKDAKEALMRIDNLVNQGVSTLIAIEKDMGRLNDYLTLKGQTLFILYDRLDSCINPLRWNKAVSPLINYWRNHCELYSNISPKIFVRTDLFKQIEGTNLKRLEPNIIHIEWTIGEVFGFFFKLIFSNKDAAQSYWAIAEKVGIKGDYIKNTKLWLEKAPKYQFKRLTKAEMTPIIQVFFGKIVKVGVKTLGSPWEYFEKELANADNNSISMRPFINTLNSNAVDKALARTDTYVREIIPSEIYASKEVRDKATDTYFDDLTQDEFSKDLKTFKDVVRTDAGSERFRYKSLPDKDFLELLNLTFNKIEDSPVVKSVGDLKELIFANGIMAEKPTTKGKYYRFAPIYWYSWGLVDSALEKEDKRRTRQITQAVSSVMTAGAVAGPIGMAAAGLAELGKAVLPLVKGQSYQGIIVEAKNKYGRAIKTIKCDKYDFPLVIRDDNVCRFSEGDRVTFKVDKEPNKKNPGKDFWYAINIRPADEED